MAEEVNYCLVDYQTSGRTLYHKNNINLLQFFTKKKNVNRSDNLQ